ncbi:hypothetical protein CsatB_016248 [Cannabis sativa]
MEWDLWNWSHDQVTVEHNASRQSEWQCDFYFGYGTDVIEERALDEKSCIQVLRILIRKADAELDELENDLVSLQTELAFAEHEEWPERCCNALNDKIGCLDIAIKSLKSKSENDIEVQLSLHREPAEKIQDLMRKYLPENDKQQPQQVIVSDVKPDGSTSDILVKEEFGEVATPAEKCKETNPSTNFHENKTNSPNKLELANGDSTFHGPECLRLAAGSCVEENQLVISDSDGTTRCSDATEQELNCENKNITLKHEEKTSCNIEIPKVDENMEAMEQLATATKDLPCEGNQAYKQTNLSNAIVEYTSLDAIIRSAAVSMRCIPAEFVPTPPRTSKSDDCDTGEKVAELSTKFARNERITIPAEFVLSPPRTLKSDDCDMEEKVAELSPKLARNERINIPPSKYVSSDLLSRIVVNGRDSVLPVTNTEKLAVALNNSTVKNPIMTKLNNVGETEIEKSQKAIVVFDNSVSDLSGKHQSQSAMRKLQSNSQIIRETMSAFPSATESSSLKAFPLKRRKCEPDDDNVRLVQLMGGKRVKKMGQRENYAKDHNASVAIILPISQSQESKKTSNLPRSSVSNKPASDSGSVDNDPNAMALSLLAELSSGRRVLDGMKIQELKTIAKFLDLTKLSKLKKSELVERISAKRKERQF